MSQENRKGRGRLVPTRPTGVEYRVQYGIQIVKEDRPHGRAAKSFGAMRWTKCSVRPAHAMKIPDGSYFLHADEGGVFQVKASDGEWVCLAA